MKRELTCIVCPMGCRIEAETDGKTVVSVKGNTCKRGEEYAKDECVNPKRTVTSTVRCVNGDVVSVKTKGTIPKDKVFECMKIINSKIIHLPVSVGDVIIDNVFGCEVVATENKDGRN